MIVTQMRPAIAKLADRGLPALWRQVRRCGEPAGFPWSPRGAFTSSALIARASAAGTALCAASPPDGARSVPKRRARWSLELIDCSPRMPRGGWDRRVFAPTGSSHREEPRRPQGAGGSEAHSLFSVSGAPQDGGGCDRAWQVWPLLLLGAREEDEVLHAEALKKFENDDSCRVLDGRNLLSRTGPQFLLRALSGPIWDPSWRSRW